MCMYVLYVRVVVFQSGLTRLFSIKFQVSIRFIPTFTNPCWRESLTDVSDLYSHNKFVAKQDDAVALKTVRHLCADWHAGNSVSCNSYYKQTQHCIVMSFGEGVVLVALTSLIRCRHCVRSRRLFYRNALMQGTLGECGVSPTFTS